MRRPTPAVLAGCDESLRAEYPGGGRRAEIPLRRWSWRSATSQPGEGELARCARRISHALALRPRGGLSGSMAHWLAHARAGCSSPGVRTERYEEDDVAP